MQIMIWSIIPWIISVIIESSFLGHGRSNIVLISTAAQAGTSFILLIVLGTQFGLIGLAIAFLGSFIVRGIIVIYAQFKTQTQNQL